MVGDFVKWFIQIVLSEDEICYDVMTLFCVAGHLFFDPRLDDFHEFDLIMPSE